jgi:heptosyltransferase-2/heptosyltransferase-3
MALTKAPFRAGFGDTGGRHLLTHCGPWDERKSWYRQCVDLLQAVFEEASFPDVIDPFDFLLPEDKAAGLALLVKAGLAEPSGPLIGIHPSAGRAIKQWEVHKFATLADRLADETGGTVLLTGGPSDVELVEAVAGRTEAEVFQLVTDAGIRVFSALVAELDLFVTGDTGPMHIAQAVGTPNLAIFGPSDPVRYGPEQGVGKRRVVREPLYCSPCNMIRKPPLECARLPSPECISRISVDKVVDAALGMVSGETKA